MDRWMDREQLRHRLVPYIYYLRTPLPLLLLLLLLLLLFLLHPESRINSECLRLLAVDEGGRLHEMLRW